MRKTLALLPYVLPRRGCVDGTKLAQYEQAFAGLVGARGAVGFWKGRVAFYAAIRALGLGEGDEIVMPAYTCMVIPAAAHILGARCVYVDIEPQFCTLDPQRLEAAITPRTRAIMIQHTYGWPNVGIERILEIAGSRGIPVLEDCCHALGTRAGSRHVGTFGAAAFFSSQWSKPYTTGLGGLLVVNDAALDEKVRRIRDEEALSPSKRTAAQLAAQNAIHDLLVYPASVTMARYAYRWLTRKNVLTGSTCSTEYTGAPPDYFTRMCEVQAVAGLHELKRTERAVEHRRAIAHWYEEALSNAGWPTWATATDSDVAPLRYPVRVKNKAEVLAAADRSLVELGDWFNRPLHSHLAPQEAYGYRTGMCPHADQAAEQIVNLPVHERIGLHHAQRVIRLLTRVGRQISQ